MAAVLLYDTELQQSMGVEPSVALAGIRFDCVVTVTHNRKATATRHPVEKGSDTTDHVKPEPREVQLEEAIVSQYPIVPIWEGPALRKPGADASAFEQLELWRTKGTLLTLVTDLDVYDSMVVENVTVPRDAKRSNSMHATIRLVEIRTVETTSTLAPQAKKPGAQPQATKGAKPKAKTETPSMRDKALDGLESALPRPPAP